MTPQGKDQLFAKTSRPEFSRVNFYISSDDQCFLDDLCYKVRRATGYKVSKSEVVRALLGIARDREIDTAAVEGFEDLKRALGGA